MLDHSPLESVLPHRTDSVLEHYRLGKEIGRGGFGVVRECIHRRTDKRFACKTVKKNDAFICRELRGELQVLRHLSDHPNIVELHEVYEDYRDVHMIMDLCRDGDLDNYIRKMPENRLEESRAAKIFSQIAEAVKFCHSNHVMHRDIKPKNILLEPCVEPPPPPKHKPHSKSSDKNKLRVFKSHSKLASGGHEEKWRAPVVKLADFGRSVFLGEGEEVSGLVCTYHFAPPEAIPPHILKPPFGSMVKGNGSYGMEADIWSLGVTLYMMLSGTLPFDSEISDEDLFSKIQSGNVDVRSGPWQNISSPARGLVLRMLSLDPKRRLTIDKVLDHPWLQIHTQSSSSSSINKLVSLSTDNLHSPSFKSRLSSFFPMQSVSHASPVHSKRDCGLKHSWSKHLKENDLRMNKNIDSVDEATLNSPNSSIASPKSCSRLESSFHFPRTASLGRQPFLNDRHFSPASSVMSFSSENALPKMSYSHSFKSARSSFIHDISNAESYSSPSMSPRKLIDSFDEVESSSHLSESKFSRFHKEITSPDSVKSASKSSDSSINSHPTALSKNSRVLPSWKSMRSTKSSKVVPCVS